MLSESFEPFWKVLNDIFEYFMGVLNDPQKFLGVLNDLFQRLTSSKSILLTFLGGA